MRVLGIDPSLTHVGYCYYQGPSFSSVDFHTERQTQPRSQFLKIAHQADVLDSILEGKGQGPFGGFSLPTHVAIEQPYVGGFAQRGGGGHQSANMWAVYSVMLAVVRKYSMPVIMFNVTQLRSLILRKKGITKADSIEAAARDLFSGTPSGYLNEHTADAYHAAKHGYSFWNMLELGNLTFLNEDQKDIFTSQKIGKGGKSGIIWRPGDFWFDFRNLDDPTQPYSLVLDSYTQLCRLLMP